MPLQAGNPCPPSFNTLLKKGSSDMVSFYETAQVLAESFSLAYGQDFHERFLAALWSPQIS